MPADTAGNGDYTERKLVFKPEQLVAGGRAKKGLAGTRGLEFQV
jgi:hypothetical protein